MKKVSALLAAVVLLLAACGDHEESNIPQTPQESVGTETVTTVQTDPIVEAKQENTEAVTGGQIDFSQLETQESTQEPVQEQTEKPTTPVETTVPTEPEGTVKTEPATESDGYYDVVIKP